MRSHCIDLFKTDLHNICFVPSVSVYRAQLYRLGFYWFDFHFSPFGGVVMAVPGMPVYTVGIRGVIPIKIATIQVGAVTSIVPPGSLI